MTDIAEAAARAVLDAAQSEEEYQQQILDLAKIQHWHAYHTRDSRGSESGFPDLVLVRGPTALFLEVKVESLKNGVVSPDQQSWIDALKQVKYVHADVVRPSHWDQVKRVLQGAMR